MVGEPCRLELLRQQPDDIERRDDSDDLRAFDDQPALLGLQVFGRWLVIDPEGPGGVASSAGVAWTVL